jgi:hypothetical protein
MRYTTVFVDTFEILACLGYPSARPDLRPTAYVVLTRERGLEREISHA